MKTADEKLRWELGIYLKTQRIINGLSQADVAARLGLKGSVFISKIEKGEAPIPLENLAAYCKAYDLPPRLMGRLVLAVMHPGALQTLVDMLLLDEDLCKKAVKCHTTTKAKEQAERVDILRRSTKIDALNEMRAFFVEHKELLPKGVWEDREVEWTGPEDVE